MKAKQDKIDAIVAVIKPMLDHIDPKLPEPQVYYFSDRPPSLIGS